MWTEDLAQLTPEDLQQLVEDEAPENETREYKQALPSGGDDDRREFLYDVASLANGGGGFLIFGVAEKRDAQNKPTGIAGALMPITVPNISSEVARLENMIRDGLAPRLTGFASKNVAIPDGNALVFSIPRSWNAPHMVTFKQVNKFYGRVSSGKYLMSVDELRRAFSQGNALREAILNWRRHRVKLLQIKQGPVPIDESPTMVMHVIPGSAFNAPAITSTWKVSRDRKVNMHCPGSGSPTFRYNADGFLKWADYGSGKTTTSYTQLFRNGIIEYVSAHFSWNAQGDPDTEANVFTDILEQELVKGYQDSLKTYQELQISGPFYVSISLFSLAGRRMYVGRHSFRALPIINEDGFESPEILIDPEKPMESLRILADLMWQAGGLEESPSVTDEGWNPFLDRSRW